jgi:plastocyanin domain-containing protein
MSFIVNLIGILLIAFIVWWFWIYKGRSEASLEGDKIDIIVDSGVYEPSIIHASLGKPLTLRFIRKDANPCAEKVIFNGLDLSAELPVDKPYDLSFTPQKKGEFEFTCQMAMYRGMLVIE